MHILRDYRQLPDLLEKGRLFVSLDVETTGLNPRENSLVELSAIKFSKDGTQQTFSELIKPFEPIPPEIENLTHITNEMTENGKTAEEAVNSFMDFLDGKEAIIIGHNIPFDLRFINAQLERNGRVPVSNLIMDTLQISRIVFPEFNGMDEPYRLHSMAGRLGIKIESAHRAYDDARVTMELLFLLAKRIKEKKAKQRIADR